MGAAPSGEPLGIIAGGGTGPAIVAAAAVRAGRPVLILGLEGEADASISAYPHERVGWGQIGRIFRLFREHGCRDIAVIGGISRRPDYRSIRLDLGGMRALPRILAVMVGGDDTVLSGAIRLFEDEGFRIVGPHEIATELVASAGDLTRRRPAGSAEADIMLAIRAAKAIGRLDAGQAAIAVNGHLVAMEGPEGTDATIARVAQLRRDRRIHWRGRAGVLGKCAKPQQDLRVDMPTVGPQTVSALAEAGLAGLVIEAGRVMLIEREEMVRAADDAGLFVTCRVVSDEDRV